MVEGMERAGKFKPKIDVLRWTPKLEEEMLRLHKGLYKFNPNSGKPLYAIDMPPPYASGRWHIAASIHYTQIDMIARTRRMQGYEVLFPMGIDRNGLPVEVQVERHYNIQMHEYPREKFLKLCREFLDEAEKDILALTKRLALSCDVDNYYQTDSEKWRAITQATFIEHWNKGHIYEDYRPSNYCPRCKTVIADAEIEYKEKKTILAYVRFKVENGEDIVIATTRPELLAGCALIIYNPKDERYKHLNGKNAIVPIYNKSVPIREHPYANPEFGTGLVMICSYGDTSDVRLFKELNLEPTILIDEDGRMTQNAGKYAGLKVEEAREKIIEDLKDMGILKEVRETVHRVPSCWRCGATVEFIPMREYYLRQLPFVDEIRKMILEGKIKFHPESSKMILLNWLDSITTDWPISRRRYYGTELPIWYCKSCKKPILPPKGKYYRPWKENPPFNKCPICGSKEGFEGETRTFDTWMDSSITEAVYCGYDWNLNLFEKLYPCSIRPQGKDIVRTWLYYTLLRGYLLFGKPAFKEVWISGMGLDEHGRAMHRHLGNVIYPWPMIEKYGSEAIRFFGAFETNLGSDFRISEQRIKGTLKFLIKVLNVARYISMFPYIDEEPRLEMTDLWILGEANKLIRRCMEGYNELNFFVPARAIKTFVKDLYAPHYIEMSKKRAYEEADGAKSAWYTLHQTLRILLLLMAPITPLITDYIWRKIYGGTIHHMTFPKPVERWDSELTDLTEKLKEFNQQVWRKKTEMKISLKDEIEIEIPMELKPFEKDLIALHNIKKRG